jgi:hypothetical protein
MHLAEPAVSGNRVPVAPLGSGPAVEFKAWFGAWFGLAESTCHGALYELTK